MTTRSVAAALSLALVVCLPSVGFADDGGTGDAGSTTSDPSCTILEQTMSGETCQECQTGAGVNCGDELGGDYSYACTQSSTIEIWCNGPARTAYPSGGCAVGGTTPSSFPPIAAAAALLAMGAGLVRRARKTARR